MTKKTIVQILLALCLVHLVKVAHSQQQDLIASVIYERPQLSAPFRIDMGSIHTLTVKILVNRNANAIKSAEKIAIKFQTSTISMPFHILSLDSDSITTKIDKKTLEASNYLITRKLTLHANYIGHAVLEPVAVVTEKGNYPVQIANQIESSANLRLPVIIIQDEGVWGTIFIISVIILMIVSYINLGAQLDEENMRKVIKRPMTLILGFLVSVLLMPLISWFVGKLFFADQTLFRIGSFAFACSPAASASTLWTVMLKSDKELSVGIQVLSNIAALVTMPSLLYLMELSLKAESIPHQAFIVPYGRLFQGLFVLLVALLVGWRFVGRNERAQKVSTKLFRPLVFSVLIFIVVFSSILYWHIYKMFNLKIMLASLIITLSTSMISVLLGYLINFDLKRAIAISISSSYKNSGITFAVLLVAFGAPDTYIAYVPSLAQIIITSLSLYLIYSILSLSNCIRDRCQGDSLKVVEDGKGTVDQTRRRDSDRSNPDEAGSEENDEFIAMNVTDIDSDLAAKKNSIDSGQQTEVKIIASEEERPLRSTVRPVSDL